MRTGTREGTAGSWSGPRRPGRGGAEGAPTPPEREREEPDMATWTPDPTFYPSPQLALEAPREELAYVAILNANGSNRPDALGVLDVNPRSSGYGQVVGRLDFPPYLHVSASALN